MNGLARDWKRRGCHCRWEVDVEVVVQELEQLVDEEEMTVVGVGDVTLASFVDDNVEQLQVAVLGVDVVTGTNLWRPRRLWRTVQKPLCMFNQPTTCHNTTSLRS